MKIRNGRGILIYSEGQELKGNIRLLKNVADMKDLNKSYILIYLIKIA